MTKIYGAAGVLTKDKKGYSIETVPNYDDELYFNLGSDNYAYVAPDAIVYASVDDVQNHKSITKHQLMDAVINFMKHYHIPYSDHNVTQLAKYALDCCNGDDIIELCNPFKSEDKGNMYDCLIDDIDDHMKDYEFIDNLPKIAKYLELDFGNLLTNRLIAWINSAINNMLTNQVDTENPIILTRSYLKEIAFLQEVQDTLNKSNRFEKEFYINHSALYDKLTGKENLAFDNNFLFDSAREMIDEYANVNNWNDDDCIIDFINTLNRYC